MKRGALLAASFLAPLLVGGAVLAVLVAGGNEDVEGWLRAASFTVLPAALANAAAAWIVVLRPRASRPANAAGVFLRALLTFAVAVPLLWGFSTIAVLLSGEDLVSSATIGGVVALFAAWVGVLPMVPLQWLAYHFTLDRRTA